MAGTTGRTLGERLFGWGARREADQPSLAGTDLPAVVSKVFPRFLSAVAQVEGPTVLDLGTVVGSNISFLGDRLACKIFVEDLYADIERAARSKAFPEFPAHLESRLTRPEASVDAILCWDVFDYLDRASASVLGRHLARVLRPGGVLHGFFGTKPAPDDHQYLRFVILDDRTLQPRGHVGSRGRVQAYQGRDVDRLFDGLRVAESVLLLSGTRDVLYRRPDVVPPSSP